MIAYKGFTKDLWSRLGDGKEENCRFELGVKKTVSASKTARKGFHCCENPVECITYYDFDGNNRFFMVEAGGDIDEDEFGRIACTEITLLQELTPLMFALECMKYMIAHQDREGWEKSGKHRVKIEKDSATAAGEGYIAIARGKDPKVKGQVGSILGLIKETEEGIVAAKLLICNSEAWIRLSENGREVEECQ